MTSCLQMHVSQICAKRFQNWVCLCFGNVLKLKVTKGELIISNHVEMADRYLLGGGLEEPPPTLVRVKVHSSSLNPIYSIVCARPVRSIEAYITVYQLCTKYLAILGQESQFDAMIWFTILHQFSGYYNQIRASYLVKLRRILTFGKL